MNSTDIFSFCFVTETSLKSAQELAEKTIKYDIEKTEIFKDLEKLKQYGEIAELLNVAEKLLAEKIVYSSVSELQEKFAVEEEFLKWLNENANEITLEDIFSQLNKLEITSDKKPEIWNSILIHSVLSNPNGLIGLLSDLLKLSILLDKLYKPEIFEIENVFKILNSKVVLPNEIFPIFLPKDETGEQHAEPENLPDKEKETSEKIAVLNEAKTHLNKIYNQKLDVLSNKTQSFEDFRRKYNVTNMLTEIPADTQSKDARSDKPPLQEQELRHLYEEENATRMVGKLQKNEVKELDESVRTTLDEVAPGQEIYDIPQVINRIDQSIQRLSEDYSISPAYQATTVIDGFILYETYPYDENCLERPQLSYCKLLYELKNKDPKKPLVKLLGEGHLNVIRQELDGYGATEIAHIKNVFAGEEFEQSHRDLKRTEEFFETETEKETEEEHELATTDHFEMSRELSAQAEKSNKLELGVNMSASYGTVSVGANASYSASSSSSSASKTATSFAKEITEKALSKVREKVHEIRRQTNVHEIEIINRYKLANSDESAHKTGIYRWAEAKYKNQVWNLGIRMMLEFYIPFPGAFYIYAKRNASKKGMTLKNPISPKDFEVNGVKLESHKNITRDNYHLWAAAYGVTGIKPPKSEYLNIQANFSKQNTSDYPSSGTEIIEIPEGYAAIKVDFEGKAKWGGQYQAFVGPGGWFNSGIGPNWVSISLPQIREKLPISYLAQRDSFSYVLLTCKLTDEEFEKWRIEIFDSIMDAYKDQKSEYESQLAALQIQAGVQIDGNSPAVNRRIEREELEKWCIESLTFDRFEKWGAMKKTKDGEPEIDFSQVSAEYKTVSFLLSAIDWNNMIYQFSPYFFNDKTEHLNVSQLNDSDPKFGDFLRAGYARVIVPVTFGFNEQVLHFLETAQVWNGGDIPVLGDPLFQSIVDNIRDKEFDEIGVKVGEPWTVKVPTNLIYLEPLGTQLSDIK